MYFLLNDLHFFYPILLSHNLTENCEKSNIEFKGILKKIGVYRNDNGVNIMFTAGHPACTKDKFDTNKRDHKNVCTFSQHWISVRTPDNDSQLITFHIFLFFFAALQSWMGFGCLHGWIIFIALSQIDIYLFR